MFLFQCSCPDLGRNICTVSWIKPCCFAVIRSECGDRIQERDVVSEPDSYWLYLHFLQRRHQLVFKYFKVERCFRNRNSSRFFASVSDQAGTGGFQVRRRGWSHGNQAERQILHPTTRGHRELHVHVEADSWPQVQGVGLGGRGGEIHQHTFNMNHIQLHFPASERVGRLQNICEASIRVILVWRCWGISTSSGGFWNVFHWKYIPEKFKWAKSIFTAETDWRPTRLSGCKKNKINYNRLRKIFLTGENHLWLPWLPSYSGSSRS